MTTGTVLPVYYPPPAPSRKRSALIASVVTALGIAVTVTAVALATGTVWAVTDYTTAAAESEQHPYAGRFACSQIDASAAVAILPLADARSGANPRDDRRQTGTVREIDCSFHLSQAGAFGTIWVRTVIAEQASDAAQWHATRVEEARAQSVGTVEELDGSWEDGVLLLAPNAEPDDGRETAGAEICVLDNNLQLCVRFHYTSAPDPGPGVPTDHHLAEATLEVVESVLLLAR